MIRSLFVVWAADFFLSVSVLCFLVLGWEYELNIKQVEKQDDMKARVNDRLCGYVCICVEKRYWGKWRCILGLGM